MATESSSGATHSRRHVDVSMIRVGLAVAGVMLVAGTVGLMALVDAKLRAAGHSDLGQVRLEASPLLLGALSAATVGMVLVIRRAGHVVGWLLIGLGISVNVAGLTEDYATLARVVGPATGLGREAQYMTGATFIPLMTFLALILLLTPTGRPVSPRWRWCVRASVLVPAVYLVARGFGDGAPDKPYQHVTNPLAVGALAAPLGVIRMVAGLGMPFVVIAAAASLVVRFRHAVGEERQQLRWVAFGGMLTAVGVLTSFVAVLTRHPTMTNVAVGFFVTLLPVFTGVAISKDHLYDLDRLISRTVVYAAVTAVVVLSYSVMVLIASSVASAIGAGTSVAIVLATLAAVSIFAPVRHRVQDVVDRRFNRRRHDALRVIDAFVRRPLTAASDGDNIEAVLQRALADPGLRIAYHLDQRDEYVDGAGSLAAVGDGFRVERDGSTIAVIHHNLALAQSDVVAAAAGAAAPELQAERLRAEIKLQLVEVEDSRARIVAAATAERKRIERNLHDGAQQRLVALAIQLRLAERTLDSDTAKAVVGAAATEIQAANQDLRELAHGLHPSILTDAGLRHALEQLGERATMPVTVTAGDQPLPPDVELAAYFIVAEAIANATKHAHASAMVIDATADGDHLLLTITDDGRGGADATSSGLLGLADRAAALRGTFSVDSPIGHGTKIVAKLPC